jgi:hypothetical protein
MAVVQFCATGDGSIHEIGIVHRRVNGRHHNSLPQVATGGCTGPPFPDMAASFEHHGGQTRLSMESFIRPLDVDFPICFASERSPQGEAPIDQRFKECP